MVRSSAEIKERWSWLRYQEARYGGVVGRGHGTDHKDVSKKRLH